MQLEEIFQAAVEHHQAGRLAEAEGLYRQILAVRPDQPGTLQMLGTLLYQTGRLQAAIPVLRHAVAANAGAADCYNLLGLSHVGVEQREPAIAAFRKAAALVPQRAEFWNNLGNVLMNGNLPEAIASYRRTVALEPQFGGGHANLGAALWENGQPREAADSLNRALELGADNAMAHFYRAIVLRELGELDGSIAAAKAALALRPGWPQATISLAMAMLLKGDLAGGWPIFEQYWNRRMARLEYQTVPPWDGSPLPGATIVLHCEHGFGDTLQLVRFVPMVAARGLHVIVRCKPELRRLFSTIRPGVQVLDTNVPLPRVDVHCSLMSLPRIFGTTLETIPAAPYLSADPALAASWRARLVQEPAGLKVGLAWAGSPEFQEDRHRSMHLSALAPLAGIPGIRFYSLQIGYAAAQARTPPEHMQLADWTADIQDFADTAALISNLDLVISTDTAVVHLAGALGKPIWVLLHHAPGCFWMLHRSDSPWYPTLRLFRQSTPRDWQFPVAQIAAALRERSQSEWSKMAASDL